MSIKELDNLVERNLGLKTEPYAKGEFVNLITLAQKKLKDGQNESNSPESRFALVYEASHALALAALRYHGYRSDNRYLVFQSLAHTLGLSEIRLFSKAHDLRNRSSYEGEIDVDLKLLGELIVATKALDNTVNQLPKKV